MGTNIRSSSRDEAADVEEESTHVRRSPPARQGRATGGTRVARPWLSRAVGARALARWRRPSSRRRRPRTSRPGERQVHAGTLSSLPIGEGAHRAPRRRADLRRAPRRIEVLAVSAICTHMRCVLKWKQRRRHVPVPVSRRRVRQDGQRPLRPAQDAAPAVSGRDPGRRDRRPHLSGGLRGRVKTEARPRSWRGSRRGST